MVLRKSQFILHGITGGYFVFLSVEDDNAENRDGKGPQISYLNPVSDLKKIYSIKLEETFSNVEIYKDQRMYENVCSIVIASMWSREEDSKPFHNTWTTTQLRISIRFAKTEAFVDTHNNSHHLKEDKKQNKKRGFLLNHSPVTRTKIQGRKSNIILITQANARLGYI